MLTAVITVADTALKVGALLLFATVWGTDVYYRYIWRGDKQ
ncbi:MAG: hypothetical protein RR505_10460 [Raoultibacter sp.]